MKEKFNKSSLLLSAASLLFMLATLVVVMVLFIFNSSFGWFSTNKLVQTNDPELSIDASPNLVIANSAGDIIKTTWNTFKLDTTTINRTKMLPATHARIDTTEWVYKATSDATVNTDTPTGLIYVKNLQNVGYDTGVVADGNYVYNAVAVDENSLYYIDYTVYIASTSKELTDVDLVVSMSGKTKDGENLIDPVDPHKAAAVDIYKNEVSVANYKGTLHVSGELDTDSPTLKIDDFGHKVPLNTATEGDKYLTYVLRFYFDGAWLKEAGKTYIRSDNVDLSGLKLNISFEAVEYVAS